MMRKDASTMATQRRLNRRDFLKLSAGAASTLVLAACGGVAPQASTGPTTSASQNTANTSSATSAPLAPSSNSSAVTLRLMTWAEGDTLALHQTAIKQFTDANPNISVEITSVPNADYYTKLQTEVAGNSAADIVNIGEAYTTRWAASNVLVDLSQFINADTKFNVDDFFPNVLDNFKYQGKLYVIPKDYVTWGLFYNKTLFDKAGIPIPTDTLKWDPSGGKYLELAQALTVKAGNRTTQYGTAVPAGWGYYMPRIWENGGRYLNDDRTQCLLGEKPAVDAIQWIADLVNKHGVAPTAESEQAGFGFASGKVAMTPQGSYLVPGLLKSEFEWAVAPLPEGPKGRRSIMYSSGYGITSQSKNPEQAWKLVAFMGREGSAVLAKPGFSVPSRRSVANQPGLFLNDQTKPHNAQVFLDAAKYMGLPEITPSWIEQEQIIASEMSRIMNGEQTAQQGLTTAAQKINDVLKKA